MRGEGGEREGGRGMSQSISTHICLTTFAGTYPTSDDVSEYVFNNFLPFPKTLRLSPIPTDSSPTETASYDT